YPLLLGGLALAGVPVLIHLIMRQKPRRLPFPAFRFLVQKHRTNQTRLRLRHLLLLLLRMGIVAALCLALARPSLTGGVLAPLAPDRPVSAVLLIDTSYSMEYAVGGKSRLDDARRRAGELLDELPDGSQVAVLDSAEVGGQPQTVAQARDRLAGLNLRHVNAPLTRQVERAYALFPDLDRLQENGAEAPHVLYVLSDRTRGCWDEAAAAGLKPPAGVTAVFIDVGVDDPSDLAVVEVKPEPTTVRPGGTVRINVGVRATGEDRDAELSCGLDGQPPDKRQSRKVRAGRTELFTFEYRAARGVAGEASEFLAEGPHQVSVKLGTSDPLPFDDAGFATFRVLGARPLLVIADDKEAAQDWADVVSDEFRPVVKSPKELSPERLDLDDNAAVCLFNVARPEGWLWARLKEYVADGHGLAVILGGQKGGPEPAAYNDDKSAGEVMPVKLEAVRSAAGPERYWSEFQDEGQRLGRHPMLAPFLRWKRAGNVEFFVDPERRPWAERFWKVRPEGQADVLLHYADKDDSPALVERTIGRGNVLVLTTALEVGGDALARWNDYFGGNSFGFVLSHLMLGHLAGDTKEPTFNYVTGQAVPLPLPAKPFLPTYTLAGPGVIGGDATLTRQPEQRELTITQATTPGNFLVLAVPDQAQVQKLAAFSMNPRPDEHVLDRVPVEQIEALLGPGSVLPVGRSANLRERLQERGGRPLELMPWLLVALLVFLALESLLANRFYRQPPAEESEQLSGGSQNRPLSNAGLRPAAKLVEEGR
ncbi:MAG TPA: BatA and WFA domain-containing protein, partial [Gemmataceae bacterium]|nr:BatA and WFA domain-containing protein [Gemmataceae bacterium]